MQFHTKNSSLKKVWSLSWLTDCFVMLRFDDRQSVADQRRLISPKHLLFKQIRCFSGCRANFDWWLSLWWTTSHEGNTAWLLPFFTLARLIYCLFFETTHFQLLFWESNSLILIVVFDSRFQIKRHFDDFCKNWTRIARAIAWFEPLAMGLDLSCPNICLIWNKWALLHANGHFYCQE